jgi:hypothetical protein
MNPNKFHGAIDNTGRKEAAMKGLCLASVIFAATAVPIAAADSPWARLAFEDLQGAHDILHDNHPGAVDTQNRRFAAWLERGLAKAKFKASAARSYSDYVRALRFYTNGFQDGHIGIGLEILPAEQRWPGFIVDEKTSDRVEVVRAEDDSGLRIGARLLSCDGQS